MGIIYKILNSVNSKVYIGQTILTLKARYGSHISFALNSLNLKPGSLHYDMRALGIAKFKCEVLERCDNSRLSDREIYYIAKYDSVKSGYNRTSGGLAYLVSSDILKEKVVELTLKGYTPTEISLILGCTLPTIGRILKSEGVDPNIKYYNGTLAVIKFDENFNRLGSYPLITEAFRHSDAPVSESTFQHNVRRACGTGEVLYNCRWALEDDLTEIVDGKVYKFKSPVDRYNYLQGVEFNLDGEYIITKNIYKIVKQLSRCKFCGKITEDSEICLECVKKHPKLTAAHDFINNNKEYVKKLVDSGELHVSIPNDGPKPQLKDRLPDKDTLAKLMETHNYRQIAAMYGVHERTLREQLRAYGIYKEKIAKNVDEIQVIIDLLTIGRTATVAKHKISKWKLDNLANKYNISLWYYDNSKPIIAKSISTGEEIVFILLKDAARQIGGVYQLNLQINSLGYRIGQKVDTEKEYLGFIWTSMDKEAIKRDLLLEFKNKYNRND